MLYKYLSEHQNPIPSEELVREVLAIRGAKSGIADQIIKASVNGDNRFIRDNTGNWYLAQKRQHLLSKTVFVLCQLFPMRADTPMNIKSIGCSRVKDGKVLSHNVWNLAWSQSDIAEPDSGVFSPPDQVLSEVARYFDHSVLVMDGFGNQYSMLNSAMRWLDGTDLENDMVSLRRLASHLNGGASVSSPSILFQVAGIPFLKSRDSIIRINNTTEVFLSLFETAVKYGIRTVEGLLSVCYPEKQVVDYSKYSFDYDFIISLPIKPGVYIMRDTNNKVIYVGKAKNLSQRVGSYFLAREQRNAKTQMILENLYDLEIHVLGSELEALLEEHRLISVFNPPINLQVEVHARKYTNWQSQILFLPSCSEEEIELFLFTNGDIRQVTAKRDLSNLGDIERIVSDSYFSNTNGEHEKNAEYTAEAQIAARWLEGRKDMITLLEMQWIPDLKTCMARVKDHILDFETGKVIHI